jgi:hypothetical protein
MRHLLPFVLLGLSCNSTRISEPDAASEIPHFEIPSHRFQFQRPYDQPSPTPFVETRSSHALEQAACLAADGEWRCPKIKRDKDGDVR